MIGLQQTLITIFDLQSASHTAIGRFGEEWLAQNLEKRGYLVSIAHAEGDLKVISRDGEILSVEVKTARVNGDGKWQFTLRKYWQGRTCADHRNVDFVVLVCVEKTGRLTPFVIPITVLAHRQAVAITSNPRTYGGALAKYRQTLKKLTLEVSYDR